MIEIIIVLLYSLSLLFIFLFSIGQLSLVWYYRKRIKKDDDETPVSTYNTLPFVTVQLPLFNERYVAERLIRAVATFDYPKNKFEIQVLDDSTDETKEIVKRLVDELSIAGIQIKQILRPDRKGFKAGALEYGLRSAQGELIAIFDADFLPEKDFVLKVAPHFTDPDVGVVQARWGHVNKDYSILTKLQAFGLDAHFTIEQGGRNQAGSFINFNGTAGIWRKSCIIDAGGWSDDTVTEDLDLSYRAQLRGWKFKYLEGLVAPAELPVIMPAVKSQQYRWNKGAAETARKNLKPVFKSSLRFINKTHAFFHLFNSSVFLFLFIAGILSIPVLYIKTKNPSLEFLFNLGVVFLIGFLSISYFYWIASKRVKPQNHTSDYFKTFPIFLTMSMGLSFHNAFAVAEGLLGIQTPFVRTPKFNIMNKSDSWKGNVYIKPTLTFGTIFEGFLCLYFSFGIITGLLLDDYGLTIFHSMLALGFASVFYYSVKPIEYGA